MHAFGPIVVEALQAMWPQRFYEEVKRRGGRFSSWANYKFQFQLNKCNLQWDKGIKSYGPTDDNLLSFSRPEMQNLLIDLTRNDTPGVEYIYGKVESIFYASDDTVTVNKFRISKTAASEGDGGGEGRREEGPTVDVKCDFVIDCSALLLRNQRWKSID